MINEMDIQNLSEALGKFLGALQQRQVSYLAPQKVPTGDGFFHYRIQTTSKELYHLKFTKSPYEPKPTARVSAGARELDEKLKHAIGVFGNGDNTLIGLNDNIILDLLELTSQGHLTYFITVTGTGKILWRSVTDFYDFVMRHDTFFKFARSNVPQAMVPTGWLFCWGEVKSHVPVLV